MKKLIIILFFIPILSSAQPFLDISYGIDFYHWTRNYENGLNKEISTGNAILNPSLGCAMTYSKNDIKFYSIGFEGNYAVTAMSIDGEQAKGTFTSPLLFAYRNQANKKLAYNFKLGYQLNWMDLYHVSNNIDRSNFNFPTYVFELGWGFASNDNGIYYNLFLRGGFDFNESRSFNFGVRFNSGRPSSW